MRERSDATLKFEELLQIWVDLRKCPIWTSSSAFRRNSLHEAGLFPEGRAGRGGDKDTWLRVSSMGCVRVAPGVTAIYHKDAVNRVTLNTGTNVRHCMCDTVESLARSAPEPIKILLFQLLNEEMFRYGIHATQGGTVSWETYRGFRIAVNPLKFVLLLAASTRLGASGLRAARHIRSWYSTTSAT
jgi:hypothetical protein